MTVEKNFLRQDSNHDTRLTVNPENMHNMSHQYNTSEINSLRPRQNRRHFADVFKCNFLNENVWIPIKISLKFVPRGPIDNIPSLVQIMAWRQQGDKPLSEPMVVRLPTHICVTRPQWVKVTGTNMGFRLQNYLKVDFHHITCHNTYIWCIIKPTNSEDNFTGNAHVSILDMI